MSKLKPNGSFKVQEELHTTAVFPKEYTVEEALAEIRRERASGNFVIVLANGGIRKMEFMEREKVEIQG